MSKPIDQLTPIECASRLRNLTTKQFNLAIQFDVADRIEVLADEQASREKELLEALKELHKVVSEYEDLVCSEAPSTHRNAMDRALQAIAKLDDHHDKL